MFRAVGAFRLVNNERRSAVSSWLLDRSRGQCLDILTGWVGCVSGKIENCLLLIRAVKTFQHYADIVELFPRFDGKPVV